MIWECEGVVNFEFGEDYSTHLFAGFHRYFVDEGMELLPEHQLTLEMRYAAYPPLINLSQSEFEMDKIPITETVTAHKAIDNSK